MRAQLWWWLERIYFAFVGVITTDRNKCRYKLLIFAMFRRCVLQVTGMSRAITT